MAITHYLSTVVLGLALVGLVACQKPAAETTAAAPEAAQDQLVTLLGGRVQMQMPAGWTLKDDSRMAPPAGEGQHLEDYVRFEIAQGKLAEYVPGFPDTAKSNAMASGMGYVNLYRKVSGHDAYVERHQKVEMMDSRGAGMGSTYLVKVDLGNEYLAVSFPAVRNDAPDVAERMKQYAALIETLAIVK